MQASNSSCLCVLNPYRSRFFQFKKNHSSLERCYQNGARNMSTITQQNGVIVGVRPDNTAVRKPPLLPPVKIPFAGASFDSASKPIQSDREKKSQSFGSIFAPKIPNSKQKRTSRFGVLDFASQTRRRPDEIGIATPRYPIGGNNKVNEVPTMRHASLPSSRGIIATENEEPATPRSKSRLVELEIEAKELLARTRQRSTLPINKTSETGTTYLGRIDGDQQSPESTDEETSAIDANSNTALKFPDPDVTLASVKLLNKLSEALPNHYNGIFHAAKEGVVQGIYGNTISLQEDVDNVSALLKQTPYYIHVQRLLDDLMDAETSLKAAESRVANALENEKRMQTKIMKLRQLLSDASATAKARRQEISDFRNENVILKTERDAIEQDADEYRGKYHNALITIDELLGFRSKLLEMQKTHESLQTHHQKALEKYSGLETSMKKQGDEHAIEIAQYEEKIEGMQKEHEKLISEKEEIVEIHSKCAQRMEELKNQVTLEMRLPPWTRLRQMLPELEGIEKATKAPEADQWDALIAVLTDEIAAQREEVRRLRNVMGFVRDSAKTTEKAADIIAGDKTKYFIGLGTGEDIPRYLRAKGKIPNRKLTKRETEAIVREIWISKKAADRKQKEPSNTDDFLATWLVEQHRVPKVAIEMAYNLVYCVDKYDYDADLDLFGAILRKDIPETVYEDQMAALTRLEERFTVKDKRIHNGRGLGKLPRHIVMEVCRSTFVAKEKEEYDQLEAALYADQPHPIIEYRRLFEENEEMDQGRFAECLRDQHLHEILDFYDDIERGLREVSRTGVHDVTFLQAKQVFRNIDPNIPESLILKYCARGFNVNFVDILHDNDRVLVPNFMSRLRQIILKRAGQRPPNLNLPPKKIDERLETVPGEEKVLAFYPFLRELLWKRLKSKEEKMKDEEVSTETDGLLKDLENSAKKISAEDVFTKRWDSPARARRRGKSTTQRNFRVLDGPSRRQTRANVFDDKSLNRVMSTESASSGGESRDSSLTKSRSRRGEGKLPPLAPSQTLPNVLNVTSEMSIEEKEREMKDKEREREDLEREREKEKDKKQIGPSGSGDTVFPAWGRAGVTRVSEKSTFLTGLPDDFLSDS